MRLIYKCACMPRPRTISVVRATKAEDLHLWMEKVRGTISVDHAYSSPKCKATVMEYARMLTREGSGKGRRL